MIKKNRSIEGRHLTNSLHGNSITKTVLSAFVVYIWLTILSPLSVTDTRYSVYLLIAVLSVLCMYDNYITAIVYTKRQHTTLSICSTTFSILVALANYSLFEPLSVLENLFDLICILVGSFLICFHILLCMYKRLPFSPKKINRSHGMAVFWGVFLSVTAINLLYLFFVLYPGVVPLDAYSTIGQILGEIPYNNVMPYWHTITVKIFIYIGLKLFGNMNAAVAFFHCGQSLFLAAVFAYTVTTIYQIGASLLIVIGVYALYAFMPYNIVYGVTLLKDIPFGAAALLFVTAFYRLLNHIGKSKKWNYAALMIGILGFSLWRTNGWYAFVIVTLLMLALLRKKYKTLLIFLILLMILGWFLIGPLLEILNVKDTNFVEAFAVPMQQVARVIYNDRPLTQEETQLLSEIFIMDRVKELYDPQTVDPVKFYTFKDYSGGFHVMENAWDYLSLYIRLGLRYPGDYLKAWIEETKGYWNGGYTFWTYSLKMGKENEYGIVQIQKENLVSSVYQAWFRYMAKLEMLQFLDSIGLYSWILAACCIINAMKKRNEFLLSVPLLVLIVGLCFGSPVFAEFRYAYPMILTTPFILVVTCIRNAQID